MHSFKLWNCKSRPNARAILPCSIVWCWGTPSTGVCSGFTAIRFRRKGSTEVIEWIPSWFGRRASTLEISLCRQSQSDMLVYCSCSLPLLWPTLDPSPSIVPSYQPWKHMTILKMVVIIHIIHIILIISIICSTWHNNNYAYYSFYCNYCWLLSCRMVEICWISGGILAWLQETYPVRRSHSEYPGQTSFGTCWWHWNYSAPNAQRLSWRALRPQAGRRRWVPDVVRQLVGIGMVLWHVINLTGFQRAKPQG
jgi:hypothetical protein